jgi:hypothetical protein
MRLDQLPKAVQARVMARAKTKAAAKKAAPTPLGSLAERFAQYGPELEYRFHPTRRWRLDLAFPRYRLAVEVEGGAWVNGRHNRGGGFIKDMEKYNALAMAGWLLLRFVPRQVKNGAADLQILTTLWLAGKFG